MTITPELIIYLWFFPVVWFFVIPVLFLTIQLINKVILAVEMQLSEGKKRARAKHRKLLWMYH